MYLSALCFFLGCSPFQTFDPREVLRAPRVCEIWAWGSADKSAPQPSLRRAASVGRDSQLGGEICSARLQVGISPRKEELSQVVSVILVSSQMVMQRSSEQEEMRAFPGPLTNCPYNIVNSSTESEENKATRCSQNDALIDKESARLLWDFVVLLCRQNGVADFSTTTVNPVSELLLQDHKTVWLPGKSPNEANLIDFTSEAVEQVAEESGEAQLSFLTDSLLATINSLEKETERFRELLLYGRKKDALESAMKHGLWGHALLLASKMDSRTHARVMTR
ncbi:hypothetical protein Chor_004271 [Crotalus horridus]